MGRQRWTWLCFHSGIDALQGTNTVLILQRFLQVFLGAVSCQDRAQNISIVWLEDTHDAIPKFASTAPKINISNSGTLKEFSSIAQPDLPASSCRLSASQRGFNGSAALCRTGPVFGNCS